MKKILSLFVLLVALFPTDLKATEYPQRWQTRVCQIIYSDGTASPYGSSCTLPDNNGPCFKQSDCRFDSN